MASTKDVLNNHLKCFSEGNLKGILSDYAPGAILFTSDGPLKGADAIRPLFQAMIAEFGKPGATFSPSRATMLTFCGPQRLLTTYMRWLQTRSSYGTARSWPQSFTGKITPKG